jgi:hypothetical protein
MSSCVAPAPVFEADTTKSRTDIDSFADETALFLLFQALLRLPNRPNGPARWQKVCSHAAAATAFLFIERRRALAAGRTASSRAFHARSGELALPFLHSRFRGHRRRGRHASHRVRIEHHRVASYHGRPPAALARRMGGRV